MNVRIEHQRSTAQCVGIRAASVLALLLSMFCVALPAKAQTQTFSNSTTILLPAPPGTGSTSNQVPGEPGSLYPSIIDVSGLGSAITNLKVTINDFRHTIPDDIDMLLVGPQGQKMVIWSDVGGLNSTCSPLNDTQFTTCNNTDQPGTTGITVTLDDAATSDMSQSAAVASGTYKPTNVGSASDSWPSPAPTGPYADPRPNGTATFAGTFNGTNPNGQWRLFIVDDALGGTGRLMGGWSLTIATAQVQASTSTSITSDTPDPSSIGQVVAVGYLVTTASGTPTGNVTVTDGVNSCTGTVAARTCSLSISVAGSRTLTATYAGDAGYLGSSGTASHLVRYNTLTAVSAHTPNPSSAGQPVNVSYSVVASPTGGPAPTGNVTVSDGGNTCTASVAAGSCLLTMTTVGLRTITATYAGDTSNNGSTSPGVAHTVKASATITLSSFAPEPSDLNGPVTVFYQVTGASGTPTGTLTVADGFNSCQALVSAGQCTISSLTLAGDRTLSATYSGDATYNGGVTSATHRVRYNTTTTITAHTPNPSGVAAPFNVTFTVVPSAAGGPAPSGNVTVTDGVNSCSATATAGGCTLALNTMGARTLTATFSGDAFNRQSNPSAPVSHTVLTTSTTTIGTINPEPSDVGQGVTVAYSITGPGAAPTGTVTVTDGVNSCSASVAAGGCAVALSTSGTRTITVSYPGDANFGGSSSTRSHVVRYGTTTTITGHSPNPSGIGSSVAINFSVSASPAGGQLPSGNVTVTDGVNNCTAAASTGGCTLVLNTPGNRTLSASFAGDGSNQPSVAATVQHTVLAASTTIIKTVSPEPSDAGQSVTIAYQVTGSGATPTGSVTISDGSASCTATVAAGQCVANFPVSGQRTISASYTGDANYAASSASASHTVRYNTTTTITADSPDPSGIGQAVSVAYLVTPITQGGPVASGNVTVTDGVNSCTATVAAGFCNVALSTSGTRNLTATYSGDIFNKGSISGAAPHQVKSAATTTIVADTPSPSNIGQSVSISYSVTGTAGTPTGNVTISEGTNTCTATVAAGSCALIFSTPGDRNIVATYSGDAAYASSTAPGVHRVRYDTTTVITSHTPNPSSVGQSVTVGFSVAPNAQGGPVPSGNVTITDGVNNCTAAAAAGACAITLSTSGARTLVATYSGDGFNKTGASAGVPHQVQTAAGATTTTQFLSDTPSPSDVSQNVVVAYSVTSAGGTPTGTVTVADGFNSCTATVSAGQCALTFSASGDRTITLTYSGDANFTTSSTQAIHRVRYTTNLSVIGHTPNPSNVGQAVTVSFVVSASPQGGPAPTGNVTVSDGTTSCTASVAVGSCTLTFQTPGTRSLIATYAGDSFNRNSVSNEIPHMVKNSSSTTITGHSPSPSDIGQTIVVGYSIIGNGPGTPTGNVVVSDGAASCTASVAAGQCAITFNVAGQRTLTAAYDGDTNFVGSTTSTSHQVMYSTTTTITGHSPLPSAPGQPVTVSFMVNQSIQGGAPPAGTVTVSDGVATCSGSVASGSCSIVLTTAGSRALSANYAGDASNKASVSAPVQHQVTTGAGVQITSTSPSPSLVGDLVTINFSVIGSGAAPTGNVTITDGAASCSAIVSAGKCAISFGTPGDHQLTATYAGDSTYAGSTSTATHRVLYGTATTITAHAPSPSLPGQSIAVTYAVTPAAPGGPTPTGNVTVTDGVNACTGTAAAGSCTITLNTLGMRVLSANYAGDPSNTTSLSANAQHLVASPDLVIAKTHAGSFAAGQQGATYTITVTNVGGAASAGTVSVVDNIPAGLTATSIAGTGWSCTQPAGPCTRSDSLAVNAGYPVLTIVVNVASNAPALVTNTAAVSGGGDGNTNNNNASDPTTIASGGTTTTLTVAKWGSATGTVSSQDGGINCGASCSHSYNTGSTVTLTATSDVGARFTGWLGACSGLGTCTVTLQNALSVSANFGQAAYGAITLDVDDNKRVDALTDGILIVRYLFGLTGAALVNGALGTNANRTDPQQLVMFLDDIEPMLDIDGNGQVDALTDGVLIVRYLFGIRGSNLTQGTLGVGATRNGAQIEAYLSSLIP